MVGRSDGALVRRLRAGSDGDLLLAEPDCWKKGAASLDGAHFGPRALAAYSSLLALRLSGLLLALQSGDERKVVWHLGPSSGALARRLRLLLPNCSQIVSGQADMLAAMAGTLRRALPGCRVLTARTSDEVGEDALCRPACAVVPPFRLTCLDGTAKAGIILRA